MATYTLNGNDTIHTLRSGKFRAARKSIYWIGDYSTFADAKRALQIANSPGSADTQRGIYIAGHNEQTQNKHIAAHFANDPFGVCNPVSDDAVRRTILAGEPVTLIGGLIPVR